MTEKRRDLISLDAKIERNARQQFDSKNSAREQKCRIQFKKCNQAVKERVLIKNFTISTYSC